MFWLTQSSVQAQCQYSSKLFIKRVAEAYDPLASVTTAAKAESNKYQRRFNVLFPLLLRVPPCFQLGADCLETSDGASRENQGIFSDIFFQVQPSKEIERMFVQKQ